MFYSKDSRKHWQISSSSIQLIWSIKPTYETQCGRNHYKPTAQTWWDLIILKFRKKYQLFSIKNIRILLNNRRTERGTARLHGADWVKMMEEWAKTQESQTRVWRTKIDVQLPELPPLSSVKGVTNNLARELAVVSWSKRLKESEAEKEKERKRAEKKWRGRKLVGKRALALSDYPLTLLSFALAFSFFLAPFPLHLSSSIFLCLFLSFHRGTGSLLEAASGCSLLHLLDFSLPLTTSRVKTSN